MIKYFIIISYVLWGLNSCMIWSQGETWSSQIEKIDKHYSNGQFSGLD